jgi:RNase adaptor protein for sRNA GlmZ degradation
MGTVRSASIGEDRRKGDKAKTTKQKLSKAQKDMLSALNEIRTLQLTPEEERILEEFEEFCRIHPIDFSSLLEDDLDDPYPP